MEELQKHLQKVATGAEIRSATRDFVQTLNTNNGQLKQQNTGR